MPPIRETRLALIFAFNFCGLLAVGLSWPPAVWAFCFAMSSVLALAALGSKDDGFK
jgi:hypothetical protein